MTLKQKAICPTSIIAEFWCNIALEYLTVVVNFVEPNYKRTTTTTTITTLSPSIEPKPWAQRELWNKRLERYKDRIYIRKKKSSID